MNRWHLLLLGAGLVLILGLLSSGLASLEFRGGRGGAWEAPPVSSPAGPPSLGAMPEWLLRLLLFTVLGLGVVSLVVSLLFKDTRRAALRRLVLILGLALLFIYLSSNLSSVRLPEGKEEGPVVEAPPPREVEERQGQGPPSAPVWSVYLLSLILGGALAFWAWRYWSVRFRQGRLAGEIREAARDASGELARGRAVSDVVIHCWLRMVEILSRRVRGVNAPEMTPREVALYLRSLGFQEEAIGRLTALFEEVRYGRKESEARREEALAALAAIERVYG